MPTPSPTAAFTPIYVEWRSKNPSDDLMTALLNVEFDDDQGVHRKLTRKEVLRYTQVVAGAGNETTGRLISWPRCSPSIPTNVGRSTRTWDIDYDTA